jgi:hypothetical protein
MNLKIFFEVVLIYMQKRPTIVNITYFNKIQKNHKKTNLQ